MRKPNVVVCMVDQLRAFEVGCYGNPVIRTPSIDRLAKEGARFEVAVTNNPVCTPARSCLLTGQYSRTCTGSITNTAGDPPADQRVRLVDRTLPEAFKAEGYDTALIGKWHVHPHPQLVGFDYALYPLIPHRYHGQTYFENRGAGFAVSEFGPEFEMSRVRRYIHEHQDRPFFLFYNISLPHMPIGKGNIPDRYSSHYHRDEMPVRPNAIKDGKPAYNEEWFKIYTIWDYFWRKERLPSDRLPDGFDLRDLMVAYYAAVACVDEMVSRLVETLSDHGMLEDTLIVFTSDHGDNLGSQQIFNKDHLYEESVRIPMVFHQPGSLAPRVNGGQVAQLIDVMPTVLDLCGVESPSSIQGRNLTPVLRGDRRALPENHAFIETPMQHIGIRTRAHLYGMKLGPDLRSIEDPYYCFYNLARDPYEMQNLAHTDEDPCMAADLRERLLSWNASVGWLRV